MVIPVCNIGFFCHTIVFEQVISFVVLQCN